MKYLATIAAAVCLSGVIAYAATNDLSGRTPAPSSTGATFSQARLPNLNRLRTTAVYDAEKRETFEEYAARRNLAFDTVRKQYAATGVIHCGDRQASAQLTGRSDILTTSAHIFFNRDNCETKARPNSCEFTVRGPGGYAKHRVKERLAIGFKCPSTKPQSFGDDWAILRLEKPIPDITPYAIPSSDYDVHKDDEAVVAIAGAARDFYYIGAGGKKTYPPNIQHCSVKFIRDVSGDGSYVETDCDGAELSSGGSLLRPALTANILLGVFMGSFELDPLLEEALSKNRKNVHPYKQGEWSGIYTSVDGRFLEELKKALNESQRR